LAVDSKTFVLETASACSLCQSKSVLQKWAPDIWQCKNCQLLFRNPRPDLESISRFYEGGSTYEQWQAQAQVRAMLWRKRIKLVLGSARSGLLLDVGTGDGFFLEFASRHFEVESTELSSTAADYARKRGFAPKIGDFAAMQLPDSQFDVVTIWHVLEHFTAPGAALALAHRALKPGGLLFIAVPNELNRVISGWFGRKAGESPFGPIEWGHEIHLSYFTPFTLRSYLRKCGFRVLKTGVDDVHTERQWSHVSWHYLNVLLNRTFGLQFDTAMYFVCSKI
jgi:2-polyprenyl-3-methyl-5-hydroxy-6-metoxy-1,4-benzoquinol methylase